MTKFSANNQVTKCGDCGRATHSQVRGTSVNLCGECLDKADLENAHADGLHDAPVDGCPDCAAEQKPAVNPNSLGARLDARGMTHRQFCRDGKHLVEVYYREVRLFVGSRVDLEAWLNNFANMYQWERSFVSRPESSPERMPFGVVMHVAGGPHGWSDYSVTCCNEHEARILAASARRSRHAKSVKITKWDGRGYRKVA